jgi:hypothetical protein
MAAHGLFYLPPCDTAWQTERWHIQGVQPEEVAMLAATGWRTRTCIALTVKIISAGDADGRFLSEMFPTDTGMSNSTQWVNVPLGASGSSIMRTKLRVSGGSWLQCSSGEVSLASHIWLAGIGPPCRKAGQLSVNPISAISCSPRLREPHTNQPTTMATPVPYGQVKGSDAGRFVPQACRAHSLRQIT